MTRSNELFSQAQNHIPGGVNSPVRAFKAVGGEPIFVSKADGPYLFDADNKRYIDFLCSWGAVILGHNAPEIVQAVEKAIHQGLSYGAPTELEIKVAEKICSLVPNMEQVRMVNSGTEATMSAIRLARAVSGKNKIIKFEGCYHGHSDALLVKAGSGALTFGIPTSPGVPKSFAEHTLTAAFNDLASVEALFKANSGDDIACIIVEPVPGNMNLIQPKIEFLTGLRELCDQYKTLLIFDEVMSGFRVALGGAQELYNINADIITLGKVIGGGMPVGAFGARKEIMQHVAPQGGMYQAGTLSGNPIAMSAGLAALETISEPGFYQQLEDKMRLWINGLNEIAKHHHVPFFARSIGAMFGLFFSDKNDVNTFQDVTACNIESFKQFFHAMLNNGVHLAPSAYEAGFISRAHDESVIKDALDAADHAFASLK